MIIAVVGSLYKTSVLVLVIVVHSTLPLPGAFQSHAKYRVQCQLICPRERQYVSLVSLVCVFTFVLSYLLLPNSCLALLSSPLASARQLFSGQS